MENILYVKVEKQYISLAAFAQVDCPPAIISGNGINSHRCLEQPKWGERFVLQLGFCFVSFTCYPGLH